jgi:hypothetical protein
LPANASILPSFVPFRNAKFSDQIGEALKQRGIVSEQVASNCVAQWAYAQTEAAHGLTWLRKDEMVPPQAD